MVGDQPHRRLRDLARKHGPDVMRLQLGDLSCIVISTPEAAKLVMKTHDVAFASRPYFLAAEVIFYGSSNLCFSPYGELWRQIRKIYALELFSAKRIQSFRRIREEEVSNLVARIAAGSSTSGKPVDLSRMLPTLTSAIISRAAFGKSQELTDAVMGQYAFMVVVDHGSDVFGGFRISDLYPSLKWLPALTGFKARLEKMRKGSDLILERIIDNHKSRRSRAAAGSKGGDDDDYDGDEDNILDILLTLQETQELGVPITMNAIKAMTLEIFLAGIDTSTTTIEWNISEMIKNPRVLHKAQQEVRQVFDIKNHFDEASLDHLKYLDMVIAESLRLHSPAPLVAPRENRDKKVQLNLYEVPVNTNVIVNAWAVNRDPRYWTEPEKFYPERFMNCSIDYQGNDFRFIPFGAGRRICPGASFGMAVVKITLASLLSNFDWTLPDDMKSIDMTECFEATLKRQYALLLIPVLRPPALN
ncbi:unnamed protein product [Linum tenue]|uniref:Cytochrome P450 n=1 Tax=Linum tenue TaxID=586396 RepID=A0AAV0GRB6_9ROSI|nr:unnamed protein product [Linum tenue]